MPNQSVPQMPFLPAPLVAANLFHVVASGVDYKLDYDTFLTQLSADLPSSGVTYLGTADRITINGINEINISPTFEGLLSKKADRIDQNNASTTSAQFASVITDPTGTGVVVLSASPTLVTPALGTPSAVVLTNGTGLPISTGVSGLGSNVAAFLATPSSTNLAAALTGETGTGGVVFSDSPTFTGTITVPNRTALDSSTAAANTKYVDDAVAAASTTIKFLAADQTTTLATAVDVTAIVFPMAANKKYDIDIIVIHGCSGAGGSKYAVTIPAAAAMTLRANGELGSATAFTTSIITVSGTLSSAFNTVASGNLSVIIRGTVTTGANAGNFQLQVASGTAAQTTTVRAEGTTAKFTLLN